MGRRRRKPFEEKRPDRAKTPKLPKSKEFNLKNPKKEEMLLIGWTCRAISSGAKMGDKRTAPLRLLIPAPLPNSHHIHLNS